MFRHVNEKLCTHVDVQTCIHINRNILHCIALYCIPFIQLELSLSFYCILIQITKKSSIYISKSGILGQAGSADI